MACYVHKSNFKPNEINYGAVEKEVLALLRMLDITLLVARGVKVLTRYYTFAYLMHSSGLNGLKRCTTLLSTLTLEIIRCNKGEDEILGTLAASIISRKDVDEMLTAIVPRKQPRQTISMPSPTVTNSEVLLVVSFDGSTRVKNKKGLPQCRDMKIARVDNSIGRVAL